MNKTIQITERIESNFDFKDWSKDKNLAFYGIGNRWKGDVMQDDNLIIFSSEYSPIIRFIDKNENSTAGKIHSFEIEQLPSSQEYLKLNFGIGLKKLKEVEYHDEEIIDNTKASFRFNGFKQVEQISDCVIEFNKSDIYSITKFDDKKQGRIKKEVKIEADIYVPKGILIELSNKKSILIKYIETFQLYFALIGAKSEIIKRNYLIDRLKIAGKTKPLMLQEKTIYKK